MLFAVIPLRNHNILALWHVPAMTHTTKQVIIVIIKGGPIIVNPFLRIDTSITQQTLSLSNLVDKVVHTLYQLYLGT